MNTSLRSLILISSIAVSSAEAQNHEFSYSYQNLSRINGGGTLETGDTIEVRALIKVNVNTNNLYYIDTIPNGTQYIPNTLRIVTNEGLLFRGPYTNAGNDDAGVYVSTAPARLRVNIGSAAGFAKAGVNFGQTTGGGTIIPNDKPKFYGKTLLVVAYQLRVTANFDNIIKLTGNFYYNDGANRIKRFNYADIRIMQNVDLCTNFSSASFTAESSFGSGVLQNRTAGANVPGYIKKNLDANSPQDNYYSIANNTSGTGSTNNGGAPTGNPARVFGVWDIIGDHTGAADPLIGNPPVAPGTNGGYMLVVNSAYPTGEAYSDMIQDVCPNTYYEFSAWIRNICGYCGIDSFSKQTFTPGVLPNIAFTINDVDYYTTGNIAYNSVWEKRGFIYKTGTSETAFKMTIKNNAAGGGGNDWVLDDIKLATCYPNLIMNPSDTAKLCAGSYAQLSDTVKSYFSNYTHYCWETSTDNGATWISTGICGSKTPVLKNGMWEYVVDTVFVAAASDSGKYFRLKVATTPANVNNPQCAVDNSQKVYMKVFNVDCSILDEMIRDFKGTLKAEYGILSWTSLDENSIKKFEIEKSHDGVHFETIGTIPPIYKNGGKYTFNDPDLIAGTAFYRLKVSTHYNTSAQYTKVISLYSFKSNFEIAATNPFKSALALTISNSTDGPIELNLFDNYGRRVLHQVSKVTKGISKIELDGVSALPAGLYILHGGMNGQVVQLKLFKN